MSSSSSSPSLQQLLDTLNAATTADTAVLHAANQQLDAWESLQPYWTALLDIAFDRSLDNDNARRLAIIRFKNGVSRYWRERIVNRIKVAVQPQTKEVLRARLLDVLYEPDRTVARQAAVAIARIARLDYPSAWPTLISSLHEAITSAAGALSSPNALLVLTRAAETLVQVLKEFESVRVMAGRLRMQDLARELLPALLPVQSSVFQIAFGDAEDPLSWASTANRTQLVRASHLLLKIIQRLALNDVGLLSTRGIAGSQENLAFSFFAATPAQLMRVWSLRSAGNAAAPADLQAALSKHLTAYAKIHYALATRANSSAVHWPGWDEVALWYWGTLRDAAGAGAAASIARPEGEDNALYPYRWLVLALRILHSSLERWHGQCFPVPAAFSGDQGAAFELEAVDVLLRAYLQLTSADLERWEANAEEFSVETDQAGADLDVRPAAEQLIAILASRSRRGAAAGVDPRTPTVIEHLWDVFDATATYSTDSLKDVLARDAVYAAVGLCPVDDVPVEDRDDNTRAAIAIENRLINEASLDVGGPWVIIRRRIAWLIWEWCDHVRVPARPAVYALLAELLRNVPGKTDAAVQLAAAKSLSGLADTLEFDADVFSPFLGDVLAGLMQLIVSGTVSEPDSIRTLAATLAVVTERVGVRTLPYAPALLQLVPSLWDAEDPEARARPSIIEFLGKLARAISPSLESPDDQTLLALHTTVAHVVRTSLQESAAPLLGYDALLLWARSLQSTHHFTTPLFSLLDHVPQLILQPDTAPLACRITDEAFMLAPEEALRHFGADIVGSMGELLGDINNPVVLPPLHTVEGITRCLGASGNQEALVYFANILGASGIVGSLIATLVSGKEATTVASQFATVIARIAYTLPPPYFHELARAGTAQVARAVPMTDGQSVWDLLIPALAQGAEYITVNRRMKIMALGVANIIRGAGDADAAALSHVAEAIGIWTDMLGRVVEDDKGYSQIYETEHENFGEEDVFDMLLANDNCGELENTAPNAKRSEALMDNDPVSQVPLRQYIAATLNDSLATHKEDTPSGSALREALGRMDPLVLDVFQKDLVQKPA
ncbi:hypothetical protein MCUN1_000515 [Malassezia cuniculi]|uniref:Importin N-terminal domain-containing protein n=1 Tax=Malassezia cuniculi TaxID=948313 RepID=A0AAF0J4R5_9BASI|nr:hypothetical protein MCUN1_000515 [Malassezia cuniculi]